MCHFGLESLGIACPAPKGTRRYELWSSDSGSSGMDPLISCNSVEGLFINDQTVPRPYFSTDTRGLSNTYSNPSIMLNLFRTYLNSRETVRAYKSLYVHVPI